MKRDNNVQLRFMIESNGIEYSEVAERIGITKGNFSKWLREELTGVRKLRAEAAVSELLEERKT